MKNKKQQIKITSEKSLTIVAAGLAVVFSCTIQAQGVNFDPSGFVCDVSDAWQGACNDYANNIYWNPIVKSGATPSATDSDGVAIGSITMTDNGLSSYNSGKQRAAAAVLSLRTPGLWSSSEIK